MQSRLKVGLKKGWYNFWTFKNFNISHLMPSCSSKGQFYKASPTFYSIHHKFLFFYIWGLLFLAYCSILWSLEDTKIKARGARALKARTNSPMCLKAKFCPSRLTRALIRGESKSCKVVDTPITKDKVVTCACTYKRCSVWNSS